ncbi:MAG: hypothetical protein ABI388_00625 [Bacteroidia bacterium]
MEEPTTFEEQTQPQGLKILCTLTFIYSGIVGFFTLCFLIFAKSIFVWLNDNYELLTSNPKITEQQIKQIQTFMEMGSGKFIIACGIYLLVLGLSLFGAIQMYQNKYKGFIMYVIANACFLISNLTTGNFFMSIMDALFIFLYFRQSKALGK